MINLDFGGQIDQFFNDLELAAQTPGDLVQGELRVQALKHAHDAIDAAIYNTAPRGGYQRTGNLRSAIDVQGLSSGLVSELVVFVPIDYAEANELGTRQYRIDPDVLLADLESRYGGAAPVGTYSIDYPRDGRKGLEPRPFVLGTVVFANNLAEQLFFERLAAKF